MEGGFDSPGKPETTKGGTVFLYRYDNPQVPNTHPNSDTSRKELVGRWFTDSLDSLKGYIKMRPPGGNIVIVEIPREKLEKLRASSHSVAKDMDIEFDNFIVPDELLKGAKRVPLGMTSKSTKNFSRVEEWKSIDEQVDKLVREIKNDAINEKLRAVIEPLQALIDQSEIPEEDGKLLQLDEEAHEINSVYSGFGRFSFKAGVEPEGFYAELPQEPTAIIRNIRIPSKIRGQGLGPKIVGVWEEELSEQGIRVFTAVNIQDKRAIDFWRKLGYQIPQGESHKAVPYCMYKVLEQPPSA